MRPRWREQYLYRSGRFVAYLIASYLRIPMNNEVEAGSPLKRAIFDLSFDIRRQIRPAARTFVDIFIVSIKLNLYSMSTVQGGYHPTSLNVSPHSAMYLRTLSNAAPQRSNVSDGACGATNVVI